MLRHVVASATRAAARGSLARSFATGNVRRVNVVLLDDNISRKGNAGDVIAVRPGYARNKLIPQKLAKYATAENVARFGRQPEEEQEEPAAAADDGAGDDAAADAAEEGDGQEAQSAVP